MTHHDHANPAPAMPYKIAVLCYLYDNVGRVLMLHRRKDPNAGMYSPIGGKLDIALGEGPHGCAKREIREETGIDLADEHLRLIGIVSEQGYEGRAHWLIFLFEVMRPIAHDEIARMDFDEGMLEWVPAEKVADLDIPHTDREIMWPLVQRHSSRAFGLHSQDAPADSTGPASGGFFMVHIDCRTDPVTWTVQESILPGEGDPSRASSAAPNRR